MNKDLKIKISSCSVIFNEKEKISGMLESVSGFVDEAILVFDGLIDDGTIELAKIKAKELGLDLKVFFRPHTGNPESHRPFSFDRAIGDWLLYIDADERLAGNWLEVRNFLKKNPDVSRIRFLLGTEEDLASGSRHRRASLFKKIDSYYIGSFGQKPGLLRGKTLDYSKEAFFIHLESGQSFRKLMRKGCHYGCVNAGDIVRPISEIEFFNADDNVKKNFENWRRKKIIFAPIFLFVSPIKAMFEYVGNRRPLKNIIASGFQVFIFYACLIWKIIVKKLK